MWGVKDDSIGVGAAKTDDLDGDGVCDFSVSVRGDYAQTWDSAVHVFSGKTQDHLRTFRFDGGESLSSLSLGYAPPGVDLDLDGLGDLLIPVGQTFHWGTSVVSSVTGQALAWIPGEIADYNSQSVVSFVQDLDGDSIPEIALMRPDQLGCSLFSTQTGALMWTQEWLNGPVATSMCTVADIDGDQIEDLAVGSPFLPVKGFAGSGKVHFLSGATGERIRRLDCEVTGDLNSDRFGVNLLWDSASETLFVRSDYGFLGTESRPVVGLQFLPFLELSDCELSAASGGHLDVWIDFPEEYQSVRYALLASRLPGESTAPSGVVIPLGMSRLFRDSVNDQLPPWFSGRTGTLNLAGDATVDLAVPSGALSVLTGSSIWFAAVAGDRNDVQVSSIAQELSIVH